MREALEELSRSRLRVAVADGGSPEAFLDAINRLPGVEVRREVRGGLLAQVRASLEVALGWGVPRVLYTEPDKHEFFGRHLRAFLERAGQYRDASLIVAARSAASFATYPPIQQRVETMVNDLCADVTGVPTDYSYGPFLCAAMAVPELSRLPADIGWGWRPYVFARIAGRSGEIRAIEGDFACPPSQRDDTPAERAHRLRQLSQNARGLSEAIS